MAKMADEVLFANLRDELFTTVVGDVLDKMGWRREFLPQAVRTLRNLWRHLIRGVSWA
jgi:4-hydroxy-4-methyl-2-oxoglutarate aldolase